MRTIYEIRRARKCHRCTEHSYHTIQAGDLYLYGVCPPEHEMNRTRPGEKRFEVIKACLRCVESYGLHSSDTRRQLEGIKRVHANKAAD